MNLEALWFAQGGVAKKDFVPALQYFLIQDNKILGFNGSIALCSPIDVSMTIRPKAAQFIKAIKTCKDPMVSIGLTPSNKLLIKSGPFTAYVDCIEEREFPDVSPSGQMVELDQNTSFLQPLFRLAPFIAQDASRPWACGILFRGTKAYATNNIILVEYDLGVQFPVEINLPEETVYELMRIKEEPLRIQVDRNHATFHFTGDRWLRTQLFETSWPNVEPIFENAGEQRPVPDYLYSALEDITPFTDDLHRVYFLNGDKVATRPEDGIGASFDVPGLPPAGCYNLHQLKLLEKIVETIDLSVYPNPCPFRGNKIRGVILGMRV